MLRKVAAVGFALIVVVLYLLRDTQRKDVRSRRVQFARPQQRVPRLCGGALASTATIGAAKGRSVTPTVPCDAPGQRRVECTNDHCKWA